MQSAKMQKVREYTVVKLILEIDGLNDNIPLNSPYSINGITVPCLRRYINDIIISYNPGKLESIIRLKQTFEVITESEIELIDIRKNVKFELLELIYQMINNTPNHIPITINKHDYPCFRNVIIMVLEGWINNSSSKYFQDRIREIFHVFYINGYTSFKDKY